MIIYILGFKIKESPKHETCFLGKNESNTRNKRKLGYLRLDQAGPGLLGQLTRLVQRHCLTDQTKYGRPNCFLLQFFLIIFKFINYSN